MCNNLSKHRVKIRVIDSSYSTTFVLFDKDAIALLNKGCADMLEGLAKVECCSKGLLVYVYSWI